MVPSHPSETRGSTQRRSRLSRWLTRGVLLRVRDRRLTLTTVLISSALVGAFVLEPGWESPVPTCFGYWVSGVPCHLCGMTRAMVYLAHGQIGEAVRFHPAVLVVFPLLVMGLLQALFGDLTSKRPPVGWRRAVNVLGWAALTFIGLFGTVRALGTIALDWVPW